MTRLALHYKYTPPPCGARTPPEGPPPPSAAGTTQDSTDICCTAQPAWNTGGLPQAGAVRGWSPCTRGFVRGSCGGERRRWWSEGGIWDAAWKAMNSERRSSEDGDPPARVSWDCRPSADSSSVQQQKQTHPVSRLSGLFWTSLTLRRRPQDDIFHNRYFTETRGSQF